MNAVTKHEGSALATLTSKLALALDIGDGTGLAETLKATAFRSKPDNPVSDAQLTALLIVANQYGLNPWTKEIYAFPDKNNGIVPVVGVDGWSRIINKHPQFDGIEFTQDENRCTCTIYRKDRSHPTVVTEYMVECFRDNVQPWKSHPYRMLRHKATIQCARLAFGFVGIYEQDEAERIVENVGNEPKHMGAADVVNTPPPPAPPPAYTAEKFADLLPTWREAIAKGKATADSVIAKAKTKGALTPEQEAAIRAPAAKAETVTDVTPKVTYAALADMLTKADNIDALNDAAALIEALPADQQADANRIYETRKGELA